MSLRVVGQRVVGPRVVGQGVVVSSWIICQVFGSNKARSPKFGKRALLKRKWVI